jgi:hypothetical protein
MTDPHNSSRSRGHGSARSLRQIAQDVHEAVPFTRPEVMQLDGDGDGVRMQVGPREYLLLMHADGRWVCGDVYVDPETGEPDTNPFVQRLMQESYRPLPISDQGDLSEVVDAFLKRAIAGWSVTAGHAHATEHERRFAADALNKSSQLLTRRPPTNP